MHNFEPKVCTRKHPRIKLPLRLADQCCTQLIKQYKRVAVVIVDLYNGYPPAWDSVRNYTNENITPDARLRVIQQSVETCTVAEALDILDLFLPGQEDSENPPLLSPIDNLNLVAANSLQFGHQYTTETVQGFVAVREYTNMNFEIHADNSLQIFQIHRLCSIFHRLPSLKPKQLAVAIAENTIVRDITLAPMLLPSLTKLSILTGATDQILGLIGRNCPSLNFLDVSLSSKVTDQGIVALLVRQPLQIREDRSVVSIQRIGPSGFLTPTQTNLRDDHYFNQMLESEHNPCASTLDTVVLTQTRATLTGIQFICRVMNTGFALDLFPIFSKVFRMKDMTRVERTAVTTELISTLDIFYDEVKKRGARGETEIIFRGRNDVNLILCHTDLLITYLFKTTGDQITTLMLHEDATLEVCKLGPLFPRLKYYFGKLNLEKGFKILDEKKYVMRDLQVVNSNMGPINSVILFLLRFAPNLVSLRVWAKHEVLSGENNFELNDTTLERCLAKRQRKDWRLEDFVVVNSDLLTTDALISLIDHCPHLKRIGDLHSWSRISEQDIADFNQRLDEMNSQCVLSVVTPPSTLREQMFHSTDMSFMRIDETNN